MADIELVVKLEEKEYINIKNAINSLIENGVERDSMSKVCLAILDGTQLPKGHGRLGDLDALREEVSSWGMNDYEPLDFIDAIDEADTIIEAEEKKTAEFHCGVEESGGHAYNCNDCPNKCEEWHQWDKEMKNEKN